MHVFVCMDVAVELGRCGQMWWDSHAEEEIGGVYNVISTSVSLHPWQRQCILYSHLCVCLDEIALLVSNM